ncbi:ArsC family reductase [Oceanicoccus sagamiensis]|uniref:ArsC family reductase n=1 Tax=Oceanicoccus sagamiensis TaxID=716816 RepID=A0A1X9NGK0_9GAMM|nr:ArsC family reductase [Oceanicoccus sagamiensis]ARN74975.1 ArsC family reductase [Oceanicoccus sagamiensis]
MTTLYGIKNCDTVKKARQWLDDHNADYQFHDFRATPITQAQVEAWIGQLGWDTVVNKRSTSWKQLSEAQRNSMDQDTAIAAILDNPTLVKRPLLDIDGSFTVGFKASIYQDLF